MCPIGPNDVAKQYSLCMTISILLENVLVIFHHFWYIVFYDYLLVILQLCFLLWLLSSFLSFIVIILVIISKSYYHWHYYHYFSRMRSKGSRFTLGVWGLRVCSLDVAFVVATVRNRPREDHMAVPMVSSAEVVIFGGFRRVVASFRVAGVALRDIQTCFATCWKSFCVAGAILLWRFQKMCCSFRGRRSTLDVSIVIFRGRRSTLDVSCCVFL